MIPAVRERGKKMAAIHAAKNETQPAASMVSFRIVIDGRERNGDISPTTQSARARWLVSLLTPLHVLGKRKDG